MIPITTYAEIYEPLGLMVGGVRVQQSRYGDRIMLDVSLSFSSLVLFFVSRPGTNGVGTGCYHFPLQVEFPCGPDPLKGRPE
jgi:hypothetical protein